MRRNIRRVVSQRPASDILNLQLPGPRNAPSLAPLRDRPLRDLNRSSGGLLGSKMRNKIDRRHTETLAH